MKSFKLKLVLLALLLPASHFASAAWDSVDIVKIKMEGADYLMVEVAQTLSGCGGSSNIIFRESFFGGGDADQKRDMFNKVYSTLLTSFVSEIPVVIGTNGCEGPSLKGIGLHLVK